MGARLLGMSRGNEHPKKMEVLEAYRRAVSPEYRYTHEMISEGTGIPSGNLRKFNQMGALGRESVATLLKWLQEKGVMEKEHKDNIDKVKRMMSGDQEALIANHLETLAALWWEGNDPRIKVARLRSFCRTFLAAHGDDPVSDEILPNQSR